MCPPERRDFKCVWISEQLQEIPHLNGPLSQLHDAPERIYAKQSKAKQRNLPFQQLCKWTLPAVTHGVPLQNCKGNSFAQLNKVANIFPQVKVQRNLCKGTTSAFANCPFPQLHKHTVQAVVQAVRVHVCKRSSFAQLGKGTNSLFFKKKVKMYGIVQVSGSFVPNCSSKRITSIGKMAHSDDGFTQSVKHLNTQKKF